MPELDNPPRPRGHLYRVPSLADCAPRRPPRDAFLRALLGKDAVVLRGRRSSRAKAQSWRFHRQSDDPAISPTASEVRAADAMLILAASTSSTSSRDSRCLARSGRVWGSRAGCRPAKRQRMAAGEEEEEEVVRPKPHSGRRGGIEGAGAAAGRAGEAQARPRSTSQATGTNVLQLLSALQQMGPNALKAAGQLGLQLPQFPIRPSEPRKQTMNLATSNSGVPMPPLFITSGAGNGAVQGSQGLPLAMFGCVLNPQAKGPKGPATAPPSLNQLPTNAGNVPVLMLPPWGLGGLPAALQHASVRPELKGEVDRLMGQGGSLLPMPLFPSGTSSAPPSPQIPLLRGLPLQSLAAQVPVPMNMPIQLAPGGPSPRSAKEAQIGRNGSVDAVTAQVAANYANLTQFLAALSSLKQSS